MCMDLYKGMSSSWDWITIQNMRANEVVPYPSWHLLAQS